MKKLIPLSVLTFLLTMMGMVNAKTDLSTSNDVDQSQSIIYAPSSHSESTVFPYAINPGFPPAYGYHFPKIGPPNNAINIRWLTRFKRIYTRAELKTMVAGKNFTVSNEVIRSLPPTDKISIFVMEDLPTGQVLSLSHLDIVGKGDKETTLAAGAVAGLWAMSQGANVLLITRAGYDRYFQARSAGESGSAAGMFIGGAKDVASAIGSVAGFTQLKSEHKGKSWVNGIALSWRPLPEEAKNQMLFQKNSVARAKLAEYCAWLKKHDSLFDAALYGCEEVE